MVCDKIVFCKELHHRKEKKYNILLKHNHVIINCDDCIVGTNVELFHCPHRGMGLEKKERQRTFQKIMEY